MLSKYYNRSGLIPTTGAHLVQAIAASNCAGSTADFRKFWKLPAPPAHPEHLFSERPSESAECERSDHRQIRRTAPLISSYISARKAKSAPKKTRQAPPCPRVWFARRITAKAVFSLTCPWGTSCYANIQSIPPRLHNRYRTCKK